MEQCPKGVELPEEAFTRVLNVHTECYTIGRQFWDSLPTWEWSNIFKANGVELPPKVEMKRLNKVARKEIKSIDSSGGVKPWDY